MIERSVAVDDLDLDRPPRRVIEVQATNVEAGVPAAQELEVLLLCLRDDDIAAPVQEEARVIADRGTDLEHTLAGQREAQRGKVLLPALIVAHIVGGPEDLSRLHAARASASLGALGGTQMLAKPVDGGAKAIRERRGGVKANPLFGPRRVQDASRLPVRLACIPADLTCEASRLRDQPDQLSDRDLLANPYVHRLRAFVAFGRGHDRLCAIIHIKELARGTAGTPAFDEGLVRQTRLLA